MRIIRSVAKWPGLSFAQNTGGGVIQSVGGGGGGGAGFPNLPAGWNTSTSLDFSQNVPALVLNQDCQIGATDWTMFNFDDSDGVSTWTKTTDATAPQSPSSIFQGHWHPGTYGGGVPGAGSGRGIGNIGTATLNGTHRAYVSIRVYFDYPDTSYWHPVSNKFINFEGNNGQIFVQLMEGGNFLKCEEEASPGFGITDLASGQLSNVTLPVKQWLHIECEVDLPNNIFRVWRDGVMTTDAVNPPFASTSIISFTINNYRGGGGETLDSDLFVRYDHILLAW